MKKEDIERFVKQGLLWKRSKDIPRMRTLIDSAQENSEAVKAVPFEGKTATLIFRQMYESLRQLGDAEWWSLGYEPKSHDVSMKVLAEMDIKNKLQLQKLDRFRRIRNDANYRGYKVSMEQAKEILEFWDICGRELVEAVKKAK